MAFDKHKKRKHMPQSDADKDTVVLLNEIKTFIVNPTYIAKVNELLDREVKEGQSDFTEETKGFIRPKKRP